MGGTTRLRMCKPMRGDETLLPQRRLSVNWGLIVLSAAAVSIVPVALASVMLALSMGCLQHPPDAAKPVTAIRRTDALGLTPARVRHASRKGLATDALSLHPQAAEPMERALGENSPVHRWMFRLSPPLKLAAQRMKLLLQLAFAWWTPEMEWINPYVVERAPAIGPGLEPWHVYGPLVLRGFAVEQPIDQGLGLYWECHKRGGGLRCRVDIYGPTKTSVSIVGAIIVDEGGGRIDEPAKELFREVSGLVFQGLRGREGDAAAAVKWVDENINSGRRKAAFDGVQIELSGGGDEDMRGLRMSRESPRENSKP
jgi:hypothetical protein